MLVIALIGLLLATAPAAPEAVSLLGEALHPMPLAAEVQAQRMAQLEEARHRLAAAPEDPLSHIWYGRRLAYLGRYRDAVDAYTKALVRFPDEARLLRHRGHRWITLRDFPRAVEDLSRAARLLDGVPDQVEPDGLPNRLGIPTSSTNGNVFYHLGLAHYLQQQYREALAAHEKGWALATNDDMRVAVAYWRALCLARLGRTAEIQAALASITPDMRIIENGAYRDLALLFKGVRTPEDLASRGDDGSDASGIDVHVTGATAAYGLGVWYDVRGEREQARSIWSDIVAGPAWPAFGHIAAEAELARESPARRASRMSAAEARRFSPTTPHRILFIGNSLTYSNDLPALLERLLQAGGTPVDGVESIAHPNHGLEDHWRSRSTRRRISDGGWSVVILQQGPSATEGRPSLLRYTKRFAGIIREAGAEPAIYMVWPARARFFDFDGVSDAYRTAASGAEALLLPVGDAWRRAWEMDPDVGLYGADGFHPSPLGTALAALVLYERLTGNDPRALPPGAEGIEGELAALLRNAAAGKPEATDRTLLPDEIAPDGARGPPGRPLFSCASGCCCRWERAPCVTGPW